ncbi:MAG: hypothetical protein OEZ59_02180 [Deltaproteobacteria bacterium]|nr:hypothetical protein [Deltaproteobacteria bacterium]
MLFNVLKGNLDKKQVMSHLVRLDKNKTSLKVQIDNSHIRFNSMLIIRGDTIVIARPAGIKKDLKKGSYIRFHVPDHDDLQVQLEVATPNFNLTNGTPVFLCKVPDSQTKTNHKRTNDRYNTRRFTNLALVIPEKHWAYRVLDLSLNGCNVLSKSGVPEEEFPNGTTYTDCYLRLGKNVRIQLDTLHPRSHRIQTVGMEFRVNQEGLHIKYLQHLLSSLEEREQEKYKAEPLN